MNLLGSQPESRKSTPAAWGLLDALGVVICVAIVCLSLALPGSANWPLFGLAIVVLAIWAGTRRVQPRDRRSGRPWEYWWTPLLVPFGIGSWVSFLSLGIHLRHPVYVVAGIFYATTVVVALWLNVASNDEGTGSDLAGVVLVCAWVASAAHAYVIRRSVRIELDRQSER